MPPHRHHNLLLLSNITPGNAWGPTFILSPGDSVDLHSCPRCDFPPDVTCVRWRQHLPEQPVGFVPTGKKCVSLPFPVPERPSSLDSCPRHDPGRGKLGLPCSPPVNLHLPPSFPDSPPGRVLSWDDSQHPHLDGTSRPGGKGAPEAVELSEVEASPPAGSSPDLCICQLSLALPGTAPPPACASRRRAGQTGKHCICLTRAPSNGKSCSFSSWLSW